MIKFKIIKGSIVEVQVLGKLQKHEIKPAIREALSLIEQLGQINVLIDLRKFNGWENVETFRYHIGYLRSYYFDVGKVCVVRGSFWQKLTLAVIKMASHKHIEVFKSKQYQDALRWLSY